MPKSPPEAAAPVCATRAAEKARLRRAVSQRIASLSRQQLARAAETVARRLAAQPEFARASRVALYAALPDELPTGPLLELVRRAGKRLLWPRTRADGRLEFAPAGDIGDLRRGFRGVLEPAREIPADALAPGDLVVVPGRAFDREGRRLGRGAGCFDRTFAPTATEVPVLFGVALALQLFERLPEDPWDRRVDAVVTERGILRPKREGSRR